MDRIVEKLKAHQKLREGGECLYYPEKRGRFYISEGSCGRVVTSVDYPAGICMKCGRLIALTDKRRTRGHVIRNYGRLIASGTRAQLEKLREKEKTKGGWWHYHLEELFKMLKDEAVELAIEVELHSVGHGSESKIRREAADVANVAHMIIQKCDAIIKKRSTHEKD